MCTRDETFTIFGVEDCLARGYERTGFFEIDTQNRSDWTLQLTDGEVLSGDRPMVPTSDAARSAIWPMAIPADGDHAADRTTTTDAEGADTQ